MSRNFELLRRMGEGGDTIQAAVPEALRPAPESYRRYPVDKSDAARILEILQKRWRIAASNAFVIATAVAVATLLMKPVYEPRARIEVEPPGSELFSLQGSQPVSSDVEYVQTQVDNLQSEGLALEVIRKLHLAAHTSSEGDSRYSDTSARRLTPDENAALRMFRSRLKVEHQPGSRLISVAFGSSDPVDAARITNTVVSLFVERTYRARHQAIVQSTEWLSRQLEDIRKRMQESSQALADFQKTSGIADVDEGKSTFGEELIELNRQLTQTAADRIQLEALLNKVHNTNSDALPQVHASALIQQLTQKRADVQAELSQARVFYGANHPKVKQLESEANEFEAQLKAQKQSILRELETSYAAAQARERLMGDEVQGTTRQLTLLARYNDLKREATANSNLYNTLYAQVKEAGIAAASKSSNVRVADPARVLDSPTRPRRLLNLAIGLLGGLVFGIVMAFVLEGLDHRIRTQEDIDTQNAGVPVSIVPTIKGSTAGTWTERLRPLNNKGPTEEDQMLLLSRPQSPEAEAVRGLRTSIMLSPLGRRYQVLQIASSLPGEGKTTVATNLAVALAQQGTTCLVDADLRKCTAMALLKGSVGDGLVEVLTGRALLGNAVVATEVPKLFALPSGREPPDPASLVSSPEMKDVVEALRRRFEFVVIDSPPILTYVDGRILSVLADGIVYLGRAGLTTREAMRRSLEMLSRVHSAPIIELVLNGAHGDVPAYRYYRYNYPSARSCPNGY